VYRSTVVGWSSDGMTDEDTEMDAPSLVFFNRGGEWVVWVSEYFPGPGPGDFRNVWPTAEPAEPAVADILDNYFGDPRRMRATLGAEER
jgi:hypothetical protein